MHAYAAFISCVQGLRTRTRVAACSLRFTTTACARTCMSCSITLLCTCVKEYVYVLFVSRASTI